MNSKGNRNKQIVEQIQRSMVSDISLVCYPKVKHADKPVIRRSADACDLFREKWDMGTIHLHETAKAMFLNRTARVNGIITVSTGGITGTVVDARIILVGALLNNATSIILAHNHPSGSLKPSPQDEMLTQKIKQAAAFHDIAIVDHLIITADGYFSMSDEGML